MFGQNYTLHNFFVKMKAYFFFQNLVKSKKYKIDFTEKFNASKKKIELRNFSNKTFREINLFIRQGFELNHIENDFTKFFYSWLLFCFSLQQNHFHSLCFPTRSEIHSTLIEIFVK